MMPDLCHHASVRLRERRVHERHHHPAPRSSARGRWDDAPVLDRLGLPARPDARARPAGRRAREPSGPPCRPSSGLPPCPGHSARDPRHRQRRGRHAARAGLGLHLVGHVVARGRRAHRPRWSTPRWRSANFTNEGGAFGTVRFLKNVMGLWILESCRREWAERGTGDRTTPRCSRTWPPRRDPGAPLPRCTRASSTPPSMTAEVRRRPSPRPASPRPTIRRASPG